MATYCRTVIMLAVNHKVMSFRLAADGLDNRGIKRGEARITAERGAQICTVLLPEAHIEHPRTGQPDAGTAFADIIVKGGNRPVTPASFLHSEIIRRPAGAICALRLGRVICDDVLSLG